MLGSVRLRRVILGIAALAVTAAAIVLALSTRSAGSASVDREPVERARRIYERKLEAARAAEAEARRLAEEQARLEAARIQAAQASGAPVGSDNVDTESAEPVLGPDGLPDRGPAFNAYNVVMTGVRDYDLDTRRSAAHRLYGEEDHDAALAMAREVLAESPDDARTHLLIVQIACATGDEALAREHRARLPEADRTRADGPCNRAGIQLTDAPTRDAP